MLFCVKVDLPQGGFFDGIRTFAEQTVFQLAVRGEQHGQGYWFAEGFTQQFSAGDKSTGRVQSLLKKRVRELSAA